MHQGFEFERIYALRIVAGVAVFCGELPFDVFGIARFGVNAARSVTDLTTRVFKLWRSLFGSEAAFLAVPRGVAFETFLQFGFIESLFEAGQALG